MKQTKLNFNGVAVLCDTWQQMLHLAELARDQGYSPNYFGKGNDRIENGYCYFVVEDGYYSNYDEELVFDLTHIPYTTFINQPTDDSVYGC